MAAVPPIRPWDAARRARFASVVILKTDVRPETDTLASIADRLAQANSEPLLEGGEKAFSLARSVAWANLTTDPRDVSTEASLERVRLIPVHIQLLQNSERIHWA